MRGLVMTAVMLSMLAAQPAWSMTCDEFAAKVQEADRKDVLRDFDMQTIPGLPGHIQVDNLPDVTMGLTCPDGEFQGLGATLGSGSRSSITRWALLTTTIMKVLAKSGTDTVALASRLQEEANNAAERTEVRDGVKLGSASETIGDWEFTFETMSNQIRFEAELAKPQ